jgi:hypothetical protein
MGRAVSPLPQCALMAWYLGGAQGQLYLLPFTNKICLLMDVAVPSERNVTEYEAEKDLKYKNVSIEIRRMLNMKCFVISIITGDTGILEL